MSCPVGCRTEGESFESDTRSALLQPTDATAGRLAKAEKPVKVILTSDDGSPGGGTGPGHLALKRERL